MAESLSRRPRPGHAAQFLRFLWTCSEGTRLYIGAMIFLTAGIGAFEAWLFGVLGKVVDWLAKIPPAQLWAKERIHLLMFGSYRIDERKDSPPRLSLGFDGGELNFYSSSVRLLEGSLDELYDCART